MFSTPRRDTIRVASDIRARSQVSGAEARAQSITTMSQLSRNRRISFFICSEPNMVTMLGGWRVIASSTASVRESPRQHTVERHGARQHVIDAPLIGHAHGAPCDLRRIAIQDHHLFAHAGGCAGQRDADGAAPFVRRDGGHGHHRAALARFQLPHQSRDAIGVRAGRLVQHGIAGFKRNHIRNIGQDRRPGPGARRRRQKLRRMTQYCGALVESRAWRGTARQQRERRGERRCALSTRPSGSQPKVPAEWKPARSNLRLGADGESGTEAAEIHPAVGASPPCPDPESGAGVQ